MGVTMELLRAPPGTLKKMCPGQQHPPHSPDYAPEYLYSRRIEFDIHRLNKAIFLFTLLRLNLKENLLFMQI